MSRSGGRLGLPADVLQSVLAFSDLRTLAAAATSSEFRDGFGCGSPALALNLVARRFPILQSVPGDVGARSPRELFLSQTRLFSPRPRPASPAPTAGLETYVFSLEILASRGVGADQAVSEASTSLFVGAANPVVGPLADGSISFTIPADVFDTAWTNTGLALERAHCLLRLMVSRRGPRGPEYARLGHGTADDRHTHSAPDRGLSMWFYNLRLDELRLGDPHYVQEKRWEQDNYFDPQVEAYWVCRCPHAESRLELSFRWFEQNSNTDMHDLSTKDLCLLLENYATWT